MHILYKYYTLSAIIHSYLITGVALRKKYFAFSKLLIICVKHVILHMTYVNYLSIFPGLISKKIILKQMTQISFCFENNYVNCMCFIEISLKNKKQLNY